MKKIGHTGTLDPMATGVLPICLGSATKLCEMLTDHDKVYEAVLLLGKSSDTQDIWGNVSDEDYPIPSKEAVQSAIESFIGGYDQIPPMYSAKKINGQKLYDLARAGITVERSAAHVIIHDIEITRMELPRVWMRVHCGRGTYIRTLCHDIGQKLGCMGLMESLNRIRVGDFDISGAITLDEVEELMRNDALSEKIISVESFFSSFSALQCDKRLDKLVRNGNPLKYSDIRDIISISDIEDNYRVYDSEGTFLGVYKNDSEKRRIVPRKMFLE